MQPIDVELLSDFGYYLPWEVVQTMRVEGTFWEPARSERTYPTPRGYVHVEELEAQITYFGGHRLLYWCLHVTGHYTGPPPSESSDTFSDSSDSGP